MTVDAVELSNGVKMPIIGIGTWQSKPGEVEAAVRIALQVGYRHIDTAMGYGNEAEIGKVLSEVFSSGQLKREDVFITTKVWLRGNPEQCIEKNLKASLEKLGLEYVDLYLLHFPGGFTSAEDPSYPGLSVEKIWTGMESVYEKKLTRAIGVSNHSAEQIERIQASAKVPIHNQQVELHLHFPQHHMQEVCQKHNISLTAYAPIGSPGRVNATAASTDWQADAPAPMENPLVLQLAKKHNKSPAQILLRHLIQRGIIVIPKSTNEKRLKENFEVFDFKLSEEEMEELNKVDVNHRLFTFDFAKGHPEDPFKAER